jgi:hypothetical protein
LVSFLFVDGDRQSTLFHKIGKKEKKRKEKATGCFATLAFSFPRALSFAPQRLSSLESFKVHTKTELAGDVLSFSLSLSLAHAHARAHTHTHQI